MRSLGWDKQRIETSMMHELFIQILQYYQKQMKKKYNRVLSMRIDAVQNILDTWYGQ